MEPDDATTVAEEIVSGEIWDLPADELKAILRDNTLAENMIGRRVEFPLIGLWGTVTHVVNGRVIVKLAATWEQYVARCALEEIVP